MEGGGALVAYGDLWDSKGVHTRTESGWTVVAKGSENPPFYLKDDTGIIRIVSEGASIHGVSSFDRTCGTQDPVYFAKGPASAIANSTHQPASRRALYLCISPSIS